MNAGDYVVVGDYAYQLQAEAPVKFIHGSRTRAINGRLVTGSWSEPWWAYSPDSGWVIVRRWKNKAQAKTPYSEAVPAQNTLVVSEVVLNYSLGEEIDLAT